MFVVVGRKIEISAAHHLEAIPHCANTHGHNYNVEAFLRTNVGSFETFNRVHTTHMTVDFSDMKRDLQAVVGHCDQGYLNKIYHETNPTAEWIAMRWLEDLRALNPRYFKLRVYETNNSFVEVEIT